MITEIESYDINSILGRDIYSVELTLTQSTFVTCLYNYLKPKIVPEIECFINISFYELYQIYSIVNDCVGLFRKAEVIKLLEIIDTKDENRWDSVSPWDDIKDVPPLRRLTLDLHLPASYKSPPFVIINSKLLAEICEFSCLERLDHGLYGNNKLNPAISMAQIFNYIRCRDHLDLLYKMSIEKFSGLNPNFEEKMIKGKVHYKIRFEYHKHFVSKAKEIALAIIESKDVQLGLRI